MSDEARAEWQAEQTRYIEGVLAGAEWQAECDAERLADLAAEVERLSEPMRIAEVVAKVMPCSCSAMRVRAEAAEAKIDRALEYMHRGGVWEVDDGAQTAEVVYVDTIYRMLDGGDET